MRVYWTCILKDALLLFALTLFVQGHPLSRNQLPFSAQPPNNSNARSQHAVESEFHQNTFQIFHSDFHRILRPDSTLQLMALHTQPVFHEGPVYIKATNELVCTSNQLKDQLNLNDQSSSTILISAINMSDASIRSIPPNPAIHMPNGATWDPHAQTVVLCSQGIGATGGSIVEWDPINNNVRVVLDQWMNISFNSPNDVIVSRKDGSVYFTDPSYGFDQGFRDGKPMMEENVWWFDKNQTYSMSTPRVLENSFVRPNGIAFNPSESILYVTDSGAIANNQPYTPTQPHAIFAFTHTVDPHYGPRLTNRRLFAVIDRGVPDGIKVDREGHVYVGCGDGVHVFNEYGVLLGKIRVPEGQGPVSNLVWVEDVLVVLVDRWIYTVRLAVSGVM